MAIVRLRYEHGHFVALDPLPEFAEGEEVTVEFLKLQAPDPEVKEMLDRTRGMWADVEGLEEALDESRKVWDQEWQDNLPSL